MTKDIIGKFGAFWDGDSKEVPETGAHFCTVGEVRLKQYGVTFLCAHGKMYGNFKPGSFTPDKEETTL